MTTIGKIFGVSFSRLGVPWGDCEPPRWMLLLVVVVVVVVSGSGGPE